MSKEYIKESINYFWLLLLSSYFQFIYFLFFTQINHTPSCSFPHPDQNTSHIFSASSHKSSLTGSGSTAQTLRPPRGSSGNFEWWGWGLRLLFWVVSQNRTTWVRCQGKFQLVWSDWSSLYTYHSTSWPTCSTTSAQAFILLLKTPYWQICNKSLA